MFYPGVSLDKMLEEYRAQYLQKKGWIRSFELRAAVDASGEPLPWLTYPAIDFLKSIVRPEWKIFEFGGGSSTAWWSHQVAEVHTVDHDATWINRIQAQCGSHVTLRLIAADSPCTAAEARLIERYFAEVTEPPLPTDKGFQFRAGLLSDPFRAYAAHILRFPPSYFDVVVIDGMARSLTTWLTIQHAQTKRCIIFDNSDREVYAPAYTMLRNAGYYRIDFWGPGPINPYEWCTSFFLRDLHFLP